MGTENNADVWYIPQNVTFGLMKSILGHCYNSQKRNQTLTSESIKKTIAYNEKTTGYALKVLENMGILAFDKENNVYSLNEVSMRFTEKLLSDEDVTAEVNEIIDHSFLSKILQIITANETITKEQLTNKILINSRAGIVKDTRSYMITIYCILDILNLSGKLSEGKYKELRSTPEQTEKPRRSSTRSPTQKKKERTTSSGNIDTSLQPDVLGIVKTKKIEVKIMSVDDIKLGRFVLDELEKELTNSKNEDKPTIDDQITT